MGSVDGFQSPLPPFSWLSPHERIGASESLFGECVCAEVKHIGVWLKACQGQKAERALEHQKKNHSEQRGARGHTC